VSNLDYIAGIPAT